MENSVDHHNMIQGYNFQKLANNYWVFVRRYAEKKLKNKHLVNKIDDIIKSTQKVFTPIDVYLKKTEGIDSVEDMQMEYMEVFEMISKLSPEELSKEKERLKKILNECV